MVCKQYGIPLRAHSLNAPCLYIKNLPEDGSLEPKHVAKYVFLIIYMLCLNKLITILYNTTGWLLSKVKYVTISILVHLIGTCCKIL